MKWEKCVYILPYVAGFFLVFLIVYLNLATVKKEVWKVGEIDQEKVFLLIPSNPRDAELKIKNSSPEDSSFEDLSIHWELIKQQYLTSKRAYKKNPFPEVVPARKFECETIVQKKEREYLCLHKYKSAPPEDSAYFAMINGLPEENKIRVEIERKTSLREKLNTLKEMLW
ncbi:MAG: hypothetical protein U5L10_04470 [Candidatus Moranbacteria bacterium]|nr:hypothetical protein [Candidatus Moranbacteria bacterium]